MKTLDELIYTMRFQRTDSDTISDAVSYLRDYKDLLIVVHKLKNDFDELTRHYEQKKEQNGKWIKHLKMLSRDCGKIYYQHDCCQNLYESPYKFCPNCGMEMEQGDDEDA